MKPRGWLGAAAPLALAIAALAVREATRARFDPPQRLRSAHELSPPPAFVAAALAPIEAPVLRVERASSRARIRERDRSGACVERACASSGAMRVSPDASRIDLELAFEAESPAELDCARMRAHATSSLALTATGARVARLEARLEGAGQARDTALDVAWLRLPDGRVRLHGVIDLDEHRAGDARRNEGELCGALALDLTFRPERVER